MKRIFFFAASLFLMVSLSGQSYLRKLSLSGIDPWDVVFFNRLLSVDDADGLSMAFDAEKGVYFVEINESGEFDSGYLYSLEIDSAYSWGTTLWNYDRIGGDQVVSFSFEGTLYGVKSGAVLALADFTEENYWMRRLSNARLRGILLSFISDSTLVVSYNLDSTAEEHEYVKDSLGVAMFLVEGGDKVWSYYYKASEWTDSSMAYSLSQAKAFPNGSFCILGGFDSSYDPFSLMPFHQPFYLLKIGSNGEVLESVGSSSDSLVASGVIINELGDVYLSGKINEVLPDDVQANAFIAKLDSNFELQWARRLHAENYLCNYVDMKPAPDGGVFFAYISYGDFPVIMGKISALGELEWYRGYSFFLPMLDIGSDGAMYVMSAREYLPDGTSTAGMVLAKTNDQGEIPSCPQFEACLEIDEVNLLFENWEWSRSVDYGEVFEAMDFSIDTFGGSSIPYCGTAQEVQAFFSLPDTVCEGVVLSPEDLHNQYAQESYWDLSGPQGIDTLINDSDFEWLFDVPGVYEIEQQVWVLGCSDFYSRELVVLPDDLSPPLGQDTLICDEGPYVLQPQSSRPLREFLWADGSTGSILPVESSGIYTLDASDGYCSVRDTVQIDFIRELLEYAPIEPIGDTVLCPDLLPWEVRPQSAYSEAFILNGDSIAWASVFHLAEAGEYSISAEIEGCLLSETFTLEVEPCEVDVYIPNAFSPNGDGLNDWVEPLGKAGKFTGIELSVYDRWGGELYRTDTPPFRWDGYSASGAALNPGVYLLRFRYYNHRAFREEEVAVEVNLVK